MIDAITVKSNKVYKSHKDSTDRWILLGAFHDPSVIMINMDTGASASFGNGGITASEYIETDEYVTAYGRDLAMEKSRTRSRPPEIDKQALTMDLLGLVAFSHHTEQTKCHESEVVDLAVAASNRYLSDPFFNAKVCKMVSEIMRLIDKNTGVRP